jgi:50S ribosomal subunit-associated GTPase HflX
MDCASAVAGLALVRRLDPELAPVPVSAWTGQGMRQLRNRLAKSM